VDLLIDTNILVRRINRHDPQYRDAHRALEKIAQRGDRICITPRNMMEFWNVATRPADKNGLALTPSHADRITRRFEESFRLLPDTVDIYGEWRKLVVNHSVSF
jgi:predicted nucleic acid-binding protein